MTLLRHDYALALYLAGRMPEREYRKQTRLLEKRVGRERYRECHHNAIKAVGEAYLASVGWSGDEPL